MVKFLHLKIVNKPYEGYFTFKTCSWLIFKKHFLDTRITHIFTCGRLPPMCTFATVKGESTLSGHWTGS